MTIQGQSNPTYLLMLTMAANTALVFQALSWPIVAIFVLSLFLNLPNISLQISMSKKLLANVFAAIGIFVLLVFGRQIGLLNSMISLLVLAYGLKLFEQQASRERNILLLLGLFLLASSMIFKQTLAYGLLYFSVLWLNLANFASQYYRDSVKKPANKSALILLQSLPLAIALFVIFPRLSAFWKIPSAQVAATGLSEEMSVGDIANLALSNELAFRVTFEDDTPRYEELYWRTIVMEDFDGTTWRSSIKAQGEEALALRQWLFNEPTYRGQPRRYQVIAEPSFQPWLFALDVAKATSNEVTLQFDYSIKRDKPLTQKYAYQVLSYPETALSLSLSTAERQLNTALPEQSNPRLRALANKMKAQVSSAIDLIEQVNATFREQQYFYTLSPPVTGASNTSLDQFFFNTKQGFCMHYAASFTYLMRAAGIPSRIVTGYLGGELHASGDFYSVYQRDAHAWSEVWIEGQGWIRVDPTAAVSPERVLSGFNDQLSDEQHRLSGSLISYDLMNSELLNWLRSRSEFLDYQWSKWVVGYSAKKQFQLLQSIFADKMNWQLPLTLLAAFILSVLLTSFWFWYRGRRLSFNDELIELNALMVFLARQGNSKKTGETVNAFLQRIAAIYPAAEVAIGKLAQCYQVYTFQDLSEMQKIEQKQSAKMLCKVVIKQIKNRA